MEDDVKKIVLQRSESLGFGFSIIGGAGSELPPVICDIVEDSPADRCEKLHAGDVILAVNSHDVRNLTTKEVLKRLRLSGPQLCLTLREDREVRKKAEPYISCSPEDIVRLRDVISQRDLTGVDEIIVKCHPSPRHSPKKIPRCVDDYYDDDSPVLSVHRQIRSVDDYDIFDSSPEGSPKEQNRSLNDSPIFNFSPHASPSPQPHQDNFHPAQGCADMPCRMDHEEPMNGSRGGHIPSPHAGHKTGIPRFSDNYSKGCHANGLDSGGEDKSDTSLGKRSERGFETFVMTGDMIIRTTSSHKSEVSRKASLEKKKKAEESKKKPVGSPRSSPRGSTSRESPRKGDPHKKPLESPKRTGESPRQSPKHSPKNTPPLTKKIPDSPKIVPEKKSAESPKIDPRRSRIPKPASKGTPQKGSPLRRSPQESPRGSPLLKRSEPSGSHLPSAKVSTECKALEEEPIHIENLEAVNNNFVLENEPDPHNVALAPEITPVSNIFSAPVVSSVPVGAAEDMDTHYEYPPPPPYLYTDLPRELDIPPDDISSEDDNYKMDGLVDMDDLPPPPDELLHDYLEKLEELPHDSGFSQSEMCVAANVELMQAEPVHSGSAPAELCGVSGALIQPGGEAVQSPARQSRNIVVSKSAEKIAHQRMVGSPLTSASHGVRNSRSHENYLEFNENGITLVDIDFDDNICSSVDALHYEQSAVSLEAVGRDLSPIPVPLSRSCDNSPERRHEKHTERVHMPTFISLEEPRSISKLKEGGKLRDFSRKPPEGTLVDRGDSGVLFPLEDVSPCDETEQEELPPREPREGVPSGLQAVQETVVLSRAPPATEQDSFIVSQVMQYVEPHVHITGMPQTVSDDSNIVDSEPTPEPKETENDLQDDANDGALAEESRDKPSKELVSSGSGPPSPEGQDSDGDSVYHQPIKDVDRPSAIRLAKRLFNLDGFKKGDISRHLGKKNDFAVLVGEEYLKYFEFSGETLDVALRKFLKQLTLAGETQERERVLAHFSRRYMENNPGSFNSEDACHTLTCAMMLLNTDLHDQNIARKMTVSEFIENLAELNDGENFPREVLKNLYHSIKAEQLECELDEEGEEFEGSTQRGQIVSQEPSRYIGHNPFLDIPDPNKALEYKKGFVMRKSCIDPEGRRTPMGKRGWKMFYATLRDMVLYLHKDEHGFQKTAIYNNMSNAIRVHHSLATKATDYTKKQHVFRLQTSEWAQYLFQTSDSKECQEWIDTLNFVASSLSAPPLPGGVGSQKKFQRPLLPASYTRLNLREQLNHHEQKVVTLEQELSDHQANPPEKGAKSRILSDYAEKDTYLQFELKRFKTYSFLLQSKMAAFPELEPSLVEVAIGEVDEPPSPPSPQSRSGHGEQGAESPEAKDTTESGASQPQPKEKRSKPVQRSMSDRTTQGEGGRRKESPSPKRGVNNRHAKAEVILLRYPPEGSLADQGTPV